MAVKVKVVEVAEGGVEVEEEKSLVIPPPVY